MIPEQFLMIIKPGFFDLKEDLLDILRKSGLDIKIERVLHLNQEQASRLYYMHKGKPFFDSLIQYMTSDKCVFIVVSGDLDNTREILGNTDPSKAREGTIRNRFGKNLQNNVMHCSDSLNSALDELSVFEMIEANQL